MEWGLLEGQRVRRKDFMMLTGLEEGTFKVLMARNHIPLGKRPVGAGWKDYSADDVLAFEAAAGLSRHGAKRSDAREWVDTYREVAIDYASRRSSSHHDAIFLGAAPVVTLIDGQLEHDHFHPLVGTAVEVAEEIERLQVAVGKRHWVDGATLCNLDLCAKMIGYRAVGSGIKDSRLDQLLGWFR